MPEDKLPLVLFCKKSFDIILNNNNSYIEGVTNPGNTITFIIFRFGVALVYHWMVGGSLMEHF